jgi:TonB-dependent SusC/RagA subfamily outer membrane receptor
MELSKQKLSSMKKTIFLFIIFCLILFQAQAQKMTITGVVNDETGMGVPGASVVVEGTSVGTITDLSGKFSLPVNQPVKAIIVSYIGYQTQNIPISGQKSLNIKLVPSAINLQEVVAVGYGTQKKVSVVGAISNVKADELSSISASNISNSLGGRVSGLIVKLQDGAPGGDDPQINIRGIGTINDASPLILIDGMEGNLGRINPNDIESFSVLKDASATAVYGVRGANGVILITTKRGLIGKPTITINGVYRMQKIINYPKFL